MHAPAVQEFLSWHQALSPEDRAAVDAFLTERNGTGQVTFGGRRVGVTPAPPAAAATDGNVCPSCHRPLP